MFQSDSDIEVDEDFLDSILSNSLPSCNKSTTVQKNVREPRSTAENYNIVSQPLTENSKAGFQNLNRSEQCVSKGEVCAQPRSQGIERKFPGPAGLLPERRNTSTILSTGSDTKDASNVVNELTPRKGQYGLQNWQSLLESITWKKFLIDLNSRNIDKEILKVINIKNIKDKASSRLLVVKKVPFVAAILQDVNLSSPDPYITLCDQTDLMSGTLHRDVWKQYGDELIPGCVLVLRSVSVLSLGISPHKNQHYLNITSSNLARLYTNVAGEIQVTNIKPFTNEEIINASKDWISNITPVSSPTPLPNDNQRTLFSSPICNQSNKLSNTPVSGPGNAIQFSSPRSHQKPLLNTTPLSSRNNSMHEKKSRQTPIEKVQHVSKLQFSPLQNINNSSATRDVSDILGLIGGKNNAVNNEQPKTACNITNSSKTAEISKTGYMHSRVVKSCHSDKNKFNNRRTLLENERNEIGSKNESQDMFSPPNCNNNLMIGVSGSGKKIIKPQNENRFSFSFSPKIPRIDSQNNNSERHLFKTPDDDGSNRSSKSKVFTNDMENKTHFSNNTNNEKASSQAKDQNDQWEVETILSSIDTDSFFDDDF